MEIYDFRSCSDFGFIRIRVGAIPVIPTHCREVGVKEVDFELTVDEIQNCSKEHKLYTATQYLIVHNKNDWAVCRVETAEGFELFRDITALEIVSLPDETAFVEDPDVDVMNPSKLVAKAESVSEETGAKTVIVKGEFDHISFASGEKRVPVVVLETVPPNPPKLIRLAERVVSSGRLSRPVKLVHEYIKIDEMAAATDSDTAVFPCRTSGLDAPGRKTLYLDQLPALDLMEGKVILFGCSLSDRIFKSHYHRKPDLVDICPADLVNDLGTKYGDAPILLKCCKFKEEYEITDNIIKVPWGTTTGIIETALNEYFSNLENDEKGGV